MQTIHLDVQPRSVGKKSSKAVRREGRVPCVLYGSHTEPVHFSVAALDMRPLVYTSETYIVALSVNGEDHECIVKSVDFHPVSDAPIHMDFQALTRGEAITITVPIRLEGIAAGVKEGGNLTQPLSELQLRCLPRDIPGHVTIDVSGLAIGDSVHVSDIDVGGAVQVLTDPSRTLVSVAAPRIEEEPDAAPEMPMIDEEGNLIERDAIFADEADAADIGEADEQPAE